MPFLNTLQRIFWIAVSWVALAFVAVLVVVELAGILIAMVVRRLLGIKGKPVKRWEA